MNWKITSSGLLAGCTLAAMMLVLGTTNASAQKRITMKEARQTALASVPGAKVVGGELEKEDGMEIYSFDLRVSGGITEVWVDSHSGVIVKTERETKADEKKEAATDRAAARSAKKHH
jgi:hypothetical protein